MRQVYVLRGLVVVLTILLLSALAAAYLAFTFARIFYASENALRLQPYGLAVYPDVPPAPLPGIKRVVFFGDSRAEAWPAPSGVAGWEFINRGIGGQTTAQIRGRFEAHVRPLQADVLVLQMGINDLRTIPIFPDARAGIIADTLDNTRAIVEAASEAGTTVILTTIFPVGSPTIERTIFFWSDDIGRAAAETNAVLRTFAGDHVIVLDADAALLGTDGRPRPEYMPDTLHLSAAGYDALNAALTAILKRLNETP